MFCRNCGSKNEDGAMFCKECGTKLVVVPGDVSNRNQEATPFTTNQNAAERLNQSVDYSEIIEKVKPFFEKIKSLPKKVLAGICTGIVALIIVFVVVINISSTINLDKYVEITYSGYNGYGYAEVSIDWDKLQNKYDSKIKNVDELQYLISAPKLEKTEELSNGDEIAYEWNIDKDEISDVLKCKLRYKNKTVTVSDLTEIATFDPYDNLEVTFTGADTAGTVTYEYNGDRLSTEDFYSEPDKGLSNGDKVEIRVSVDGNKEPGYVAEYFASEYGEIPNSIGKEYTVEGLGRYISLTEANEEYVYPLKQAVGEIINENELDWDFDGQNIKQDSLVYLGVYLATPINTEVSTHNYLGFVYQIDSHIENSEGESIATVTQYYDVAFRDAVVKEDGTFEADVNSPIISEEYFEKKVPIVHNGWWSYTTYDYYDYFGYASLASLVSARKDLYADDYTLEWQVDGVSGDMEMTSSPEYLCSYSSERLITEEEIEEYLLADYSEYGFPGDRDIIQMIINEMYARYGYQFTDSELTDYFSNKEWYSSLTDYNTSMDDIYDSMTSIEKDNITLLQEYQ